MTTKQDEFEERLNNLDEVKSNDTQKITQFNNYFQQFKKVLGTEIGWHQAVIKGRNPDLLEFLKRADIDVQGMAYKEPESPATPAKPNPLK